MCLKENYSDSQENYRYSRHYSAESEYIRRQNMNSKLGEEQKVEVLISTQIRKITGIRDITRPSPSIYDVKI